MVAPKFAPFFVIPAKAGIQLLPRAKSRRANQESETGVPACAGTTVLRNGRVASATRPFKSTQLHAVHEPRRRPAFELHAELQAALEQHVLDLGQRLLAEVRRLQQLDFGLLHEIADVIDALGLEAVRRADRELEIVDRTKKNRIDAALLGLRAFALATR